MTHRFLIRRARRGPPVPVLTATRGGGRTLNPHPGEVFGNPSTRFFCVKRWRAIVNAREHTR